VQYAQGCPSNRGAPQNDENRTISHAPLLFDGGTPILCKMQDCTALAPQKKMGRKMGEWLDE
jgi:hypothetical protein